MGMRTDAEISGWQEWAGIKPATGEHLERLTAISNTAFELIKLIELERSGIAEGDGCWHGADPMNEMVNGLVGLLVRTGHVNKQNLLALAEEAEEIRKELKAKALARSMNS